MIFDFGLEEAKQQVARGLGKRWVAMRMLWFGLAVAGLLVMGSCRKAGGDEPGSGGGEVGRPVPVLAGEVVRRGVPVQVPAVGNAEAYQSVGIKTQVTGRVDKVHFKEGEEVKAGAMLFTIDPRPFEAQVREAEAQLSRDEARLEFARGEVQRYENLMKTSSAPRQKFDQVVAEAKSLAASVDLDRATVETAKLNLEHCFIKSPIDGQTGNLLVDAGNVVKETDLELVRIKQVNPIYVRFAVPQQELGPIQRYRSKGRLAVLAWPPSEEKKDPEKGELTFVNNEVDRTTGTIELKATFGNASSRLWPGQFVRVVLVLTTEEGLVVSSQAIARGQEGTYVYVIRADRTVEYRPVEVVRTLNGESVIGKGLKAGERVVTDGQMRLVPGSKVEIKTGLTGGGEARR